MKKYLFIMIAMCTISFSNKLVAQNWTAKTNLLYDATATINLGAEVAVAEKWTIDLSGNWNSFQFSNNKKWKHWLVQPEARYWLCRKFGGHFFAGHILGGQYNIGNIDGLTKIFGSDFSKLENHRFEGGYVGFGLGYGYAWMLSKHWNLETEIGIGAIYTEFDKYLCEKCGDKIDTGKHVHYGVTKLALNLVYVF